MIELNNLNEADNIERDLIEIKEMTKIKKILSSLYMYDNNPKELTDIYTDIFFQDNVSFILTKLSQDKIFLKHFPEFYERNGNGENVINCQQNSHYHKYGVFKHILCTIEYVGNSNFPIGDWQKKLLKWTMFLHDIGKPYVKISKSDGTDSFIGHEEKSVQLSQNILDRFYFTDEEKDIILKFIKYHDKFLNEEEVTYDNMSFLAKELNNNKEMFYLLIYVKDADAKAKNDEVYDKYKSVRNKYIDFINTYFVYNENEAKDNNTKVETLVKKYDKVNENGNSANLDYNVKIGQMDTLLDDIIKKKNIFVLFQPVIDLVEKKVCGYEASSTINSKLNIDMAQILNYAKGKNMYDRVQQTLLMNKLDAFDKIEYKESDTLVIRTDLNSYNKYINKPRIYDLMAKNEIVLKFINYENIELNSIQETIKNIHDNKGFIALENFGLGGNLKFEELNFLNLDYIVPDSSIINNITQSYEKQKFLSSLITYALSKDIKIIISEVNDIETLNTLAGLGIRYVIGDYFAHKEKNIQMITGTLDKRIGDLGQDTVV